MKDSLGKTGLGWTGLHPFVMWEEGLLSQGCTQALCGQALGSRGQESLFSVANSPTDTSQHDERPQTASFPYFLCPRQLQRGGIFSPSTFT